MLKHLLTTQYFCDVLQLEEEIQEDLKWSILVKEKLYSGKSDFQSVEIVESGPFGKVQGSFLVFIHLRSTRDIPHLRRSVQISRAHFMPNGSGFHCDWQRTEGCLMDSYEGEGSAACWDLSQMPVQQLHDV